MNIIHQPSAHRFEVVIDGKLSVLEYVPFTGGLNLVHTAVHPELEGKGVGTALVRFALDYIKAHQLTMMATCPFVKAFLKRHPDYLQQEQN
ncbi:MAG: N-acetyltransferase [Flavobacteriales bacterium]|nr:N-acetyltransferase [Flavobacteriales bacterium]